LRQRLVNRRNVRHRRGTVVLRSLWRRLVKLAVSAAAAAWQLVGLNVVTMDDVELDR
jgi:hypothetical protein